MSLPFRSLPHRLRPGDVMPVQLVNRLGQRLVDARAMVEREHRVFDPSGGAHEPLGQPIASRLFARPAGVGRWDFLAWAEVPPLWSYGAWDGDARWEGGRIDDGSTPGRDAVRIKARVTGLSNRVSYRGRVLVEIDPAVAIETSIVFGADWQPGEQAFGFLIPLDVLQGARLVCIQVF